MAINDQSTAATRKMITEDLNNRFSFHVEAGPALQKQKNDRYARVREACRSTAEEIMATTGRPSREQSLAVTKLEEAMFWANAAIARQ